MDLPFFIQDSMVGEKIQLVHSVVGGYAVGADADPPEEQTVVRTSVELRCHQRNDIPGNIGALL